ncbi:FprA family A-type flavoprotein [Anaeropeptidivorans aminofermentans]|uniref:FprA family A-type flavoprotein n=1 Tax=Anaeropeptidivorans aminofermentans TaxID=2934315 RepID=UPI0020251E46|nr:FprA family A-type flavoprotein [Anaeropeptidivorans aminofermentans]
MHCVQNITPDIFWVGDGDRRLERFENMFPLPNGVSYNSYIIKDEKIALMDTVDASITRQFFENIEYVLGDKKLDYLVINHMEPDHCANIGELLIRYPNVKIVGNKKTFQFISQFYDFDISNNMIEISEGDEIFLGKHTLRFFLAPMVHWPEAMFSYEKSEGILFSADAFGSFGAFTGNLFADETDIENLYIDEYRRYYSNIVGKYGPQVQNVLKKLAGVNINMICPLHGPVWRENLPFILDKYNLWSTYTPEKNGVVLFYGSMYGNTENTVSLLANLLSQKGIKDLRIHDVSKTNPSYIISDVFKYSHMVIASPTYNNGLYLPMESLIHEMAALNIQKRKASIIGNGSWAPMADKRILQLVSEMKNMEIVGTPLVIHSSLKEEQLPALKELAEAIYQSME